MKLSTWRVPEGTCKCQLHCGDRFQRFWWPFWNVWCDDSFQWLWQPFWNVWCAVCVIFPYGYKALMLCIGRSHLISSVQGKPYLSSQTMRPRILRAHTFRIDCRRHWNTSPADIVFACVFWHSLCNESRFHEEKNAKCPWAAELQTITLSLLYKLIHDSRLCEYKLTIDSNLKMPLIRKLVQWS